MFGEYDDDTPTAIAGGERVPRGMTVRLRGTSAARHRYWDPREILETGRYEASELPERFDELMGRAATRSLLGDDVLSLSGGTDSSAVAAYAAPAHLDRFGRPLAALSVVYPQLPAVDEREEIELVAGRLGIELHTYEESAKTLDEVDAWMRVLDEPLPLFFVAESAEHLRRAHAMGYRNMLTGEMAEWVVERRSYLIPHLILTGRFGPALDHLRRQRREHGTSVRGIARQVGAAFVTPRMRKVWARLRPARIVDPAVGGRDASAAGGGSLGHAGAGHVAGLSGRDLPRPRSPCGSRGHRGSRDGRDRPTPVRRSRPRRVLPLPPRGAEVPRHAFQEPAAELPPGTAPRCRSSTDPGRRSSTTP